MLEVIKIEIRDIHKKAIDNLFKSIIIDLDIFIHDDIKIEYCNTLIDEIQKGITYIEKYFDKNIKGGDDSLKYKKSWKVNPDYTPDPLKYVPADDPDYKSDE